jgi:hypothetical protein
MLEISEKDIVRRLQQDNPWWQPGVFLMEPRRAGKSGDASAATTKTLTAKKQIDGRLH